MTKNIVVFVCCLLLVPALVAADTQLKANSDTVYQALRTPRLGTEVVRTENVVLKRDAATFTFVSGALCFLEPVQGKVTGAVFTGEGRFELTPTPSVERTSLSRLTKQPGIVESFGQLVLRFTDDTYEQLRQAKGATAGQTGACDARQLDGVAASLRKPLRWNLAARMLSDLYAHDAEGVFFAFIRGRNHGGRLVYAVDPLGIPGIEPDQAVLLTWSEEGNEVWTSFRLSGARGETRERGAHIVKQQLDITLDKAGRLNGKAIATLEARRDLRMVEFDLLPTLRVTEVRSADGRELDFIQEEKGQDADFWVILPQTVPRGQPFSVTITYGGKEAVQSMGGGNYYVVARRNWYPNGAVDDFASYEMRFTYPKDLKLVATGIPGKESTQAGMTTSEWHTELPQTVAGFQLGRFRKEQKVVKGITLEAYANEELPASLRGLQASLAESEQPQLNGSHAISETTLGAISTTGMAKKALAEAEVAIQLYTDYFGPTRFTRLALTQQTATNYGQSWPELIWLPMSYFFDDTVRHQLMGFDQRGYFKMVGPHEIAHQWWGHTVAGSSYRDQWMEEGFADFSASLFMQAVRGQQEYLKFWSDERDLLTERNKEGFRAIDAGPLTLGYRLSNAKLGGDITRRLIYPKGAYVLHMLRMMMWSPKTGDGAFKQMMHDFVATYAGKAATTADFKAMVEKYMTPGMDLTHDHRMDWFFDEYVEGTALPKYRLDYRIEGGKLKMKVTQSGVDERFRMLVPVYLEFANGKVGRLGVLPLVGNDSREVEVTVTDVPKRVMLNYYADVLCEK
jgi:hypothetical protein